MVWMKRFLAALLVPHEKIMEERFLSQAVDLADLEWRMKEIARGRFRTQALSWS